MPNTEFDLGGINHLALVPSDMRRTIDFYSGVEVAAPEGYGSRDISADLTAGS